jgi:hypothetical protein
VWEIPAGLKSLSQSNLAYTFVQLLSIFVIKSDFNSKKWFADKWQTNINYFYKRLIQKCLWQPRFLYKINRWYQHETFKILLFVSRKSGLTGQWKYGDARPPYINFWMSYLMIHSKTASKKFQIYTFCFKKY